MPKISVITLSHDRAQFLATAIHSMLCQTMPDWEMIIIDDASTDPEVHQVLDDAEKDSRIRVFKEPENINNLAILWNKGLDLAQGKYISILDDDNKKDPLFCEKMSQYLDDHKKYNAVACLQQPIDQKDGFLMGPFRNPLEANKESILERNHFDCNEVMFRKKIFDLVGYFDERLTRVEDWDFFIRVLYETNGIAILPEKLGYYRLHNDRRMFQTWNLEKQNVELVKEKNKNRGKKLKISCIYPEPNRLTWTQKQVCKGIQQALYKIPFISFMDNSSITSFNPELLINSDFILLIAPFQAKTEEVEKLAQIKVPIVNIHMEDPQAILANSEIAKFASWIVTNDVATIPHYKKIIDPKKVLFCPSLSISEDVLNVKTRTRKKFDVVVCGTAYDSRIEFMKKFLRNAPDFTLFLLGDDWDKKIGLIPQYTHIMSAQNEMIAMKIHHSSKIIVCLHRTNQDIGGFPIMPPQSIQRGYIEAYSGALVMIDNKRPQHSFGENEVAFFSSPEDLREKIDYYLAHPQEAKAMAKKAQIRAKRDFTFRARLTKLLNCLRSERYGTRIP